MSSTATAIPNRRQIVRACKTKGWSLQPVVLQAMEEHLARHRSSTLPDLLVLIGEQVTTAKTVTAQVWDQVQSKATGIDYYDNGMEDSHDDDDDDNDNEMDAVKTPSTRKPSTLVARHHHTSQQHNDWHVVSAFKMPRLVYQTMRKQFLVEEKSWSLFGTPEDKVSFRYHIVPCRLSSALILTIHCTFLTGRHAVAALRSGPSTYSSQRTISPHGTRSRPTQGDGPPTQVDAH